MKKILIGLAAAMALSATGTAASAALPVPKVYTLWCGTTLIYSCGMCVEFEGGLKNCTHW